MFSRTDFWIGLAVGAVAGVFGYKLMEQRQAQMEAMMQQQAVMPAEVSVEELKRQKEELENLIAAQGK